jgi:outer membrane protein assembly factor BamB
MKNIKIHIMSAVLLLFTVGISAQDWPQFLGPDRNSTSSQKNVFRSWPQNGPEVLWSVDIGIGYGGPVVKDDKVYILDRDDKVGDKIRCFDLNSGEELWSFGYDAPGSVMFPGSRSVPVVDGNYIYTCGPYGDLYCVDVNTHKAVWNKNVWKDYGGGRIPTWAISQCPLVYGDLLIIASQAPEAGVVAYNKLDGTVKWKTPSIGPVGYVSPTLVKVAGEDQVVMISASEGRSGSGGKVVGIDPLTGRILWEYTGWQCRIPVPCAVDAGDSRMLIAGGYNAGVAMIKVEKKSDGSYGVKELYKNPDFGAHTQPPVLYNGYFYAQYSTNERKDGLVCMSMDGEVKWKTGRDPMFDKGGMIIADGMLLTTDGRNTLYLIQPDPDAFKPLAKAELLGKSESGSEDNSVAGRTGGSTQNWAPLALSDGKLIIRDQKVMKCVKVAE